MTQKRNSSNAPRVVTANATTTPGSRYGSTLNSRFGTSNVTCEIVSVGGIIVRFDLHDLGEPLCELLGIAPDQNDQESVIQIIEHNDDLRTELASKLDVAWEGYDLCGAMLVYPWQEGLRQAVAARLLDAPPGAAPTYLRALDPLLVLNVLARARSQILLAASPPDLERPFLERSLAADDPRLVALACATEFCEMAFEAPVEETPAE